MCVLVIVIGVEVIIIGLVIVMVGMYYDVWWMGFGVYGDWMMIIVFIVGERVYIDYKYMWDGNFFKFCMFLEVGFYECCYV